MNKKQEYLNEWEIVQYKDWGGLTPFPVLFHKHDEYYKILWTCVRVGGLWRCSQCDLLTPEELAFCADLANCQPIWNSYIRHKKDDKMTHFESKIP